MNSSDGKRRFGCGGCLRLALAAFACLWVAHWWFGPIRYLQFHASHITDDYDDAGAGFTGDFTRKIAADCSEEVFHRFAARQGLTQRFESHAAAQGFPNPFNLPDLKGAYYYHRDGGEEELLAYHNGRLYYYINVW